MSFADKTITFASKVWRIFGLRKTSLTRLADRVRLVPLPFGLSYEQGKLYGWNISEKLDNPEPETVAFFRKHIKPVDRIADVGANIGYYTLLFSRLVGESGRVFSFEPSPRAFACLKKSVKLKKNVEAINKGVYSRSDMLRLYFRRPGDPMGSVAYKAGRYFTDVPVIALRDFPQAFDWAKIDVEGSEIEVLKGMKMPMRAVLEVAWGLQEEHLGGVKKFFDDIEALGYKIYFIVDGGEIVPYDHSNMDALRGNIYIEPRRDGWRKML